VTTRDFNPTSPLPGGLTEADLLAIVEGEPLPREREAVVARTLAANPAMARELEAMKRDRAGLRSLGEERAPAGLMESVGAALQPVFERQMLLGLADGEALSDGPPVSMVMPRRNSLFAGRKLAMAAGLALVAGGVAFTAMSLNWGSGAKASGRSRGSPRLADVTPAKESDAAAVGDDGRRELALAKNADEQKPVAVVAANKANDEPVGPPAALADDGDAGKISLASTGTSDESSVGPPSPAAMELAQALELASDHRLIVRVIAPDGRFDRVTERLLHARGAWQLAGAAPVELASILDAPSGLMPQDDTRPERPKIAGMEGAAEPIELPGPPEPPEFTPAPSVYLLNLRMDEVTLATLASAIRDAGGEVVFEDATQALPIDSAPVVAPGAVLWWGNGPSGWAVWVSVPVVIQR
jgi:hypothetical protein